MTPRKISIESYPTPSHSDKAALLFVHGAYVNSSCWTFNFIPFFQAQGYDCFTVDLSGHGDSEGRERIDDFGIGDYVDDVKLALVEIGRPAIVVGHSMGARVLERFLENGSAARDIRELRGLLDAWRDARRTAWQTFVKLLTTGFLAALLVGAAIKFKLVGGAP